MRCASPSTPTSLRMMSWMDLMVVLMDISTSRNCESADELRGMAYVFHRPRAVASQSECARLWHHCPKGGNDLTESSHRLKSFSAPCHRLHTHGQLEETL